MFESIGLVAISGVLGALTGILGSVFAIKYMLNQDKILEISDVLIDEVTQNTEYQKKIYLIGGLLGQGIKQGIGLPGSRGKFKIEDAIGQLIAGYAQKFLFGPEQAPGEKPKKPSGLDKPIGVA